MPEGKNDVVEATQRGLTRLESLLKMAGALLVLVAGMGVPAVYVQFRNYGIPTDFVTYGEVLRAGAVPSTPLRRWMPEPSSRQAGTRIVRLIEHHWRRAEASGISLAFLLLWTAGSTVLVSIVSLIGIRAAFRIWLPQYATVLTGGRIAAVALTTTLLVFLFFTVFFVGRKMESDDKVQRRQGVWLAAGTVVLGYLLCAVLYSTSIYPTLWRGLGGGRPIPVTVWLDGESLTSSLR